MTNNNEQMSGLPININKEVDTPKHDAKSITKLVKDSGKIVGYELSNGEQISKDEAISQAKRDEISGVSIATRKGTEYLRSLPDDNENNNLSSLPTADK